MKHIYFCRHGLSQLNKDGKWAGSLETPLTEEGKAGATLAGHAAKYLHIDYILSSPLSRAYDTAVLIAKEIGFPVTDIEVNKFAVERHFGELEGTPWISGMDLSGVKDLESDAELLERARKIWQHLKSLTADNILVVSHGSFGRALRHTITPSVPFKGSEGFENSTIVTLL